MASSFSSRNLILTCVLSSVICLAYFYLLDNAIFSSQHFLPIYRFLLTVRDVDTAWLAVGVATIAALWRWPDPIRRVVATLGASPVKTITIAAIALAAITVFVNRSYPLCMDEYAAVFQAKIFAAGRLTAQLPPALVHRLIVPSFNGSFLFASDVTGQAVEGYWPGFAAVLAPFELLRAPWLCNSLVTAFALYLIFSLTLEVSRDRVSAGWALLFSLCSSAFLAYGASFYSMQAHLAANLLFARLLFDVTPKRAFMAGLVGSLALTLHNPMPHALFAAPWLLALALDRQHRTSMHAAFLGYLPGLAVTIGWLLFRSSVFSPGNSSLDSGIGGGVFGLPDLSTFDARASSTVKMILWAVPGLFIFAGLGAVEFRDDRRVRLLLYSAVGTFAGYCLVRIDQGHGWGNRYFHSAWGVIPILAGLALGRKTQSDSRLVSFAGAAAILAVVTLVPFQLRQIHNQISNQLDRLPVLHELGNSVTFIRTGAAWYSADLVQVDPFLRDKDLIMISEGERSDLDMLRRNWPHAEKGDSNFYGASWSLGSIEQRRLQMINPLVRYSTLTFGATAP